MKVISVGTDRKLFEEGSAVRARQIEYGRLVDELHIIVFTRRNFQASSIKHQINSKSQSPKRIQISENVFAYPTNSLSRWLYVFDAISIGKRIFGSWYLPARQSPGAGGELGTSGTDIVVTAQDPAETGYVGRALSKKYNIPLQVQVHTDIFSPFFKKHSFLNRIRVRMARSVLSDADCIRVVSKRIKASIIQEFPVLSPRISVLPIFVDIKSLRSKENPGINGIFSQFRHVGVMAGRLEKEKDIPTALKVFDEVLRSFPRTGLLVLGEGSMKGELEKKARQLKLSNNVLFLGRKKDIAPYLLKADFFLHTARYEGFGMVFVEAAAADCPVVSTNVGTMGDILKDGESALVCPVGGIECLSKKLSLLLENKGLRRQLVLKAQEAIEPLNISREEYLQRMKQLWDCS